MLLRQSDKICVDYKSAKSSIIILFKKPPTKLLFKPPLLFIIVFCNFFNSAYEFKFSVFLIYRGFDSNLFRCFKQIFSFNSNFLKDPSFFSIPNMQVCKNFHASQDCTQYVHCTVVNSISSGGETNIMIFFLERAKYTVLQKF